MLRSDLAKLYERFDQTSAETDESLIRCIFISMLHHNLILPPDYHIGIFYLHPNFAYRLTDAESFKTKKGMDL